MSEYNEYIEYMRIQQEILVFLKKKVRSFGSFKDVGVEMREHHKNDKVKSTIQKIEGTTLKDIKILREIHKDIFERKIFQEKGE